MAYYLGIDVGSVSTKLVALEHDLTLAGSIYLPTAGNPKKALNRALQHIKAELPTDPIISGIAITGSGRQLASEIIPADIVKNEITCQAICSLEYDPDVQTVIEIGGQDSKLIVIRKGLVVDFGMNNVCAAGTGSFLSHQAHRLGMSVEEIGKVALMSKYPAKINATCTVFAESDMITKQQSGCSEADIVYGLCKALISSFRRSVIQSKPVMAPLLFQGGVAHNKGIQRALRDELGMEFYIHPHPELTGAIGAALLCAQNQTTTRRDFEEIMHSFSSQEEACNEKCI